MRYVILISSMFQSSAPMTYFVTFMNFPWYYWQIKRNFHIQWLCNCWNINGEILILQIFLYIYGLKMVNCGLKKTVTRKVLKSSKLAFSYNAACHFMFQYTWVDITIIYLFLRQIKTKLLEPSIRHKAGNRTNYLEHNHLYKEKKRIMVVPLIVIFIM